MYAKLIQGGVLQAGHSALIICMHVGSGLASFMHDLVMPALLLWHAMKETPYKSSSSKATIRHCLLSKIMPIQYIHTHTLIIYTMIYILINAT